MGMRTFFDFQVPKSSPLIKSLLFIPFYKKNTLFRIRIF
ncbi:hypothetical protein RV02_GL003654 [Enterococcus gilvus]|nr:hypothetical protein RV02_GL003654 [Enterococcus gilvus]